MEPMTGLEPATRGSDPLLYQLSYIGWLSAIATHAGRITGAGRAGRVYGTRTIGRG